MEKPSVSSPVTVELVVWRKAHCRLENGSHGIAKQKTSDYNNSYDGSNFFLFQTYIFLIICNCTENFYY